MENLSRTTTIVAPVIERRQGVRVSIMFVAPTRINEDPREVWLLENISLATRVQMSGRATSGRVVTSDQLATATRGSGQRGRREKLFVPLVTIRDRRKYTMVVSGSAIALKKTEQTTK